MESIVIFILAEAQHKFLDGMQFQNHATAFFDEQNRRSTEVPVCCLCLCFLYICICICKMYAQLVV